jgi:hypothetical protein
VGGGGYNASPSSPFRVKVTTKMLTSRLNNSL